MARYERTVLIMKEIIITALAISTCWYVALERSEIKRFNEQKEFIMSIAILKHQIMDLKQDKWRKDELLMDIESSFSDNNYKEAIRFKKIYFKKPL